MKAAAFGSLVDRIKHAAEHGDGATAAALFTDDAVVVEPPDRRLIQGRSQIRDYFDTAAEGTELDIHHFWFAEDRQVGAVEFTYAPDGDHDVTHGIFLLALVGDQISEWREYAYPGPRHFGDFLRVDGKDWKFTVEGRDLDEQ